MSEMKTYKFSNLYEMSSGISSKPEQAGHGAPFLSFSSVFNNYFLPDILPDLMDTSQKEKEVYSIQEGDIFLTRTSETLNELGMSSVAIKEYPNASFSGFLKRLRPKQKDVTYHKFMAFYLRSKLFRKVMTNNAIMTLRASLNEQIFSYLDLILPEFDDQKRIGDLLYTMNLKIELNNKINAELEAMAKLIYDYWFVQFDFPMNKEQAKAIGKPAATGKPYKSSGGKMVYNKELKREIPEGWEMKPIGEYAEVKKGDLITAKDAKHGEIKVVAAGIGYSYTHNEYNRLENTITISGSGANAGFINFWREPIFASDCITVRGKNDIDTILLLHHLRFIQNHILSQATGSAQPHVYPSDIKILSYIIPSDILFHDYGKLVVPMNKQIAVNLKENQKLSELRDWLLPMLMNGQVKVTSAKASVTKDGELAEDSSFATAKEDKLSMAAESKGKYTMKEK